MDQEIFLVVGSSPENLVLNDASAIKVGDILEIWVPERRVVVAQATDVAGNIVETGGFIDKNGWTENIPPASLVLLSNKGETNWYISKYYDGTYDQNIKDVMKAFGVEDYCLPKRK